MGLFNIQTRNVTGSSLGFSQLATNLLPPWLREVLLELKMTSENSKFSTQSTTSAIAPNEKLIIGSSNAQRSQPHIASSQTANMSYRNALINGIDSHPKSSPTPAITSHTKICEVIIKLNNPEAASKAKKKTTEEISSSINNHMQQNGFKTIRAARALRSGDIAIQAINESEAEMLRGQCDWSLVLGEDAKSVKPTFGVMVFNVRTDEINPKEMEKSIDMIKECNKEVESLKAMNISWLGWFKLPKPGQPLGHLILEFDSPNQANAAIDKSLVIGSSLETCQVYNRACKLQQCFNCQNYGHSTSQCIKDAACCQCAGAHSFKECPGNLPKKCATCKGAHTAFDKSCRLREQEILRVVSARAETPSRYPVKMLNQTPAHSTTLETSSKRLPHEDEHTYEEDAEVREDQKTIQDSTQQIPRTKISTILDQHLGLKNGVTPRTYSKTSPQVEVPHLLHRRNQVRETNLFSHEAQTL